MSPASIIYRVQGDVCVCLYVLCVCDSQASPALFCKFPDISRIQRFKIMASGKERANRRDNFNQSVIQILYKRAGGRCCKCRAATFGPITNNPNKYRNIGQAAHIAAAAPGGPRYNSEMSIEERTSAANGLWLCSNCHDQVDRDLEEFTVAVLKKMRREAEDSARKEIGIAAVSTKVRCCDM